MNEGRDVELPLNSLLRLFIFFVETFLQTATLEQEVAELHLEIFAGKLSLANILQIFIVVAIALSLPAATVSITLFLEHFFDEHI